MVGRGGQLCLLDPAMVLPMMARVTEHIGLGLTYSSTFNHPYQIARMLSTLDHLSGGAGRVEHRRLDQHAGGQEFRHGRDARPRPALRSGGRGAGGVLRPVGQLGRGRAAAQQGTRGRFADPSKIHYANYAGKWIRTRGPLTTPRCPQGRPVIMQAGSSERGRDFGARWGRGSSSPLQHEKSDMQEFYRDFKSRDGWPAAVRGAGGLRDLRCPPSTSSSQRPRRWRASVRTTSTAWSIRSSAWRRSPAISASTCRSWIPSCR